MNSLEILKAQINLKTTLIKFKSSLEELREKHEIDKLNKLVQNLKEGI